ncbi:uncharacterized protein A4U43_C04F27920 [Asparagus officinalis]|uniref:Uncharacterized protein n=1 Tax=Asparagus officinalis TaxID=4686 RepID=A0A5P1F5X9_ASPOF|nr:uncharacterized protein A4U43_C04F27920 [Asparagus officinalis]
MYATMPGSGNVTLLQRYECSKWLVRYLAGVRRILQNKDHYRLYCCFPLIDGLSPGDEFEDSTSCKEPIPLDNKEEQVDYGQDDTDVYLTEPKDVGNFSDVGGSDDESDFRIMGEDMLLSLPLSG